MLRNTEALQDAVRGPHTRVSRVKVVRDGVVVRELLVHAGRVDVDRTATHMRRFTCDVSDPIGELSPYDLKDELAPFGTDVVIETGVRVPVVTEVAQVFETQAQWLTGTRAGTTADANGDLVLGNIQEVLVADALDNTGVVVFEEVVLEKFLPGQDEPYEVVTVDSDGHRTVARPRKDV